MRVVKRRSTGATRLPRVVTRDIPPHVAVRMPTKRLAADSVLTDEAGRLLVLEPRSKVTCDVPGGIVDGGESPRLAVVREFWRRSDSWSASLVDAKLSARVRLDSGRGWLELGTVQPAGSGEWWHYSRVRGTTVWPPHCSGAMSVSV
jgi:hypothetical protein